MKISRTNESRPERGRAVDPTAIIVAVIRYLGQDLLRDALDLLDFLLG